MQKKQLKNLVISISTTTILKTLLVLVVVYFIVQFKDLVLVMLTAVVIASAIEPATVWFIKYRIPRVVAVITIYTSIAIMLTGIMYLFMPVLVDEVSKVESTYNLSSLVEDEIDMLDTTEMTGEVNAKISFGKILDDLQESFSDNPEQIFQRISMVFGGVFSFILIIVISFYLAVQERGIEEFLKIITPIKQQKYIIGLWKRSQIKIGLWMKGQLLLGLIIGIMVYMGLTIFFGMEYALLLALLAAFAELIPIFGPIIAAIPAIMIAYTGGITLADPGFAAAIAVALFYIIIQQFENHLIYPLVVRKVVGVSPLVVILALVIGAQIAGFLGILLAVPVAAVIMELTNDIQKERHLAIEKEKNVNKD